MPKKTPRPRPLSGAGRGKGPGARIFEGPVRPVTNSRLMYRRRIMSSHSMISSCTTKEEPEGLFVARFLLYHFICLSTFVGEGKREEETLVDEGIR